MTLSVLTMNERKLYDTNVALLLSQHAYVAIKDFE